MQNIREMIQVRRALAGVIVFMASAVTVSAAEEEPLRWKFNKGNKYDYDMVQDMTIASTGGPGGPQNVTMHQELKMTWDLQDVTKDGDALIQQKIESVKMKMELPQPVGAIEYDSTAKDPPTGPAAILAPMYQALMKGAFQITMSPRGEIKDVKIPPEVAAALKNSQGAAAMGDMATPEGFKKMISQGSLVLPEKAPTKDEEWSTKVEVNNPQAGKQVVETIYKYLGTKEIEGVKYAAFQPTVKMNFEGSPAKISEQQSTGEILFNIAEGRLASSKLEQHVTLEQAGVQTKIDQNIGVKVTAGGEAADKDASKAEAEATK
jgi:hypothetical protein